MGMLYALGETYTGEVTISAKLSEGTCERNEKLANWKAARDWFPKSLNIRSKVSNPAWIGTSGVEITLPDEVPRLLAESDNQLASPENSVPSNSPAKE